LYISAKILIEKNKRRIERKTKKENRSESLLNAIDLVEEYFFTDNSWP